MGISHIGTAFDLDWHFDTATQRFIWLQVVYLADRRGMVRFTQAEIAERCLLSRATVARELLRLQEIGLLQNVRHGRWAIRFPVQDGKQAGTPAAAKRASQATKEGPPLPELWENSVERILESLPRRLEMLTNDYTRLGLESEGEALAVVNRLVEDGKVARAYTKQGEAVIQPL